LKRARKRKRIEKPSRPSANRGETNEMDAKEVQPNQKRATV
jgi:hypothetical protein